MPTIDEIAKLVQKYAPQYGIKVYSPIIAQGILESASFTSELAVKANNYFGLKYRAGRCPSASGTYSKVGSEQTSNGSYVSSNMLWFKFPSVDAGVRGYFDFTNISTYKNLKGITDPRTYLETIKKDGYCTSIKYVDNVMAVINKYNLTKYDDTKSASNIKTLETTGGNKMKLTIHAGHNPKGKIACGAVGLLDESEQDRIIKDKVIAILRAKGHTVYDCTVDNGTSQNDVLRKIVAKCNSHDVDLHVSIHLNSGANDRKGNGRSTGTEVLIYNSTSDAKPYAQRIVNNIASLGFKNRGVKVNSRLYFLKRVKGPALLVETLFCDDADDVKIYNADKMAKAIAEGILGTAISSSTPVSQPVSKPSASTNAYTFKDFVKDVQRAIGVSVDGIPGPKTLAATPTVSAKKNRRHAVVRYIQKYLNSIGYDCGAADGIAGSKFTIGTIKFQRANGCVADGEVTARGKTWKKLLKLG